MKNCIKRSLCLLLALAMVLSCGFAASAEENPGVAVNTATGQTYDDLGLALKEAGAGQTVRLMADVQTEVVLVREDAQLDLNGCTLTADYAASFGHITDRTGGGLLRVTRERMMLQPDNAQLPARDDDGYRFFDVTKFNTAWKNGKFCFQPFLDQVCHELLKADPDAAGISVNVRVSWQRKDGNCSQLFVYNSGKITDYLSSYLPDQEKYERMFTLTLTGADGLEDLTFEAVVASDTGVEIRSDAVAAGEEPEDNILIRSEEFLYGSYFDHDRFEGNTGTRLTSGDYGKIRSADALLPAQDITIKVTDTDLTNYKVTLGYFDKNGNYTGRNGILPMENGELTITAAEMRGTYFRVNVYLYNGRFTKVPETARIVVYGGGNPVQPGEPEPSEPTTPPTDPTEPSGPEEENPWVGKKITILGDSISCGAYPGILKELTEGEIQNLAVSGSLLAGGITGKVSQVAEDADVVIVFGGTNDYWHKNTPIGAADSTDSRTFVGALRYIHTYLKAERPMAQLLFVFPPDQTFQGKPCTTDFGYGTLDDFRAAFLNYCETEGVPYLDLGETEFDSGQHSGDGVHPNGAGHRIIARAIYDRMQEGLETSVTVTR